MVLVVVFSLRLSEQKLTGSQCKVRYPLHLWITNLECIEQMATLTIYFRENYSLWMSVFRRYPSRAALSSEHGCDSLITDHPGRKSIKN